jgi:Ca2+-transporting ATPase
MAARNALIRNLPSVETLGCVDVICSDKTGTLTRNEMTVRRFWVSGHRWEVTGEGFSSEGRVAWIDPQTTSRHESEAIDKPRDRSSILHQELVWLNQVALSCNNASWRWNGQSRQATSVGDPTEVALLVAASKLEPVEYVEHLVPAFEVPFDSERKMMSQVYLWPDGRIYMFAKGAGEVILGRCNRVRMYGKELPMQDADRAAIMQENNQLADQALRVLGLAYRTVKADRSDWSDEQDLVFVGLVGMMDPPREEVAEAVAKCRNAGIRPVMITGDHPQTALAIGKSLQFAQDDRSVMSGSELDSIDEHQLRESVDRISIFARVSAQHKLRIVDAFRSNGHVVAMTGDGVNDAPAVKKADIGIVMGITGTDVAKEAADMVLTDDNFASIVNAVEEGRGIYENIQKFLHFLLACNFSEVLFMFVAALVGWASPLLPIQILWINLVTDGIPALALAMEPIEKHLMSRSPRSLSEAVLPAWRIALIAWHGALMAATALFAYAWMLSFSNATPKEATTFAFCTITLSQVFFSIGCRSFSKTMPQVGFFTNPTLVIAMVVTVFIQVAVVSLPWTAKILQVHPVRFEQWPWIIGLSMVPVTIVEVAKLIYLGVLRRPLDATK